MLLFGNEGSKPKKGTGRAPPGPSRPRGLQSNADPNKSQKSASPSNLFVPSYNEPESLRLPRLPTPDQRNEGPQRDTLRPMQQADKLQPVSAREPIQRGEDDETGDSENRHDNRRRVSSPMIVQEQPSFRQRSRIEDEDEDQRPEEEGRIIRVDSRLDGRAWEGDAEGDRDPVAASFREAKMQCQVLKKKEGSKDFPIELKALEARLKTLEGQVMRDRITIIKRAKEQKHNSTALQRNLADARNQMHQTMAQAADDVIVLTQKLKSVEEEFAQCRVDRDYEKMSFQNEKEIMKAQSKDVEEQLMKARLELSETARRMKSAGEEVKLLTKLKGDVETEAKILQERVDAMQDEISQLKSSKSQLERQVMTLEGDVSMEKNNVKNEVARVQMERERHNERLMALESQLERALQDAGALEDFKTEATEFRRKFQQAEKLLDEAEEVRKEALKNAHAHAEQERADAVGKVTQEAETLRRQLKNAQDDKAEAQSRLHTTVKDLQEELAAANARVGELTGARVDAQEQLTKETERLLSQVRKGQEDVARSAAQLAEVQETMLKEQEAAQSKQMELKQQLSETKGQAQESQLKVQELTAALERARAERGEADKKAEELRATLAEMSSSTAVEDLRGEIKGLRRELEEARKETERWRAKAEEAHAEAEKQRQDALNARRQADQEGVNGAKLHAEKEVFAGMVKDLIAQLSRARMDSLAAVAGKEMPLEAQASHLQSLLASARAQKAQTEEVVRKADPEARRALMHKFVTDYRSSRSSSVLSLAEGVPLPLPAPSPLPANASNASALEQSSVQPPSEVSLVARDRSDASELKPEESLTKQESVVRAESEGEAAPAATHAEPADGAAGEAAEGEGVEGLEGVGDSLVIEGAAGDEERAGMVITPSLPSTPGSASPVAELEDDAAPDGEPAAPVAAAAEGEEGWEAERGAEDGAGRQGGGVEAEVEGQGGGGKAEVEGQGGGGEAEAEGLPSLDDKQLEAAAVKIQARARGMRDRNMVREHLEEQMAAYAEDEFEQGEEAEGGGGEGGAVTGAVDGDWGGEDDTSEATKGEEAPAVLPLPSGGSQQSLGLREGSGGEGRGGEGPGSRGSSAGSRREGSQKPRPPDLRPEGVAGGSFRNRSGSRGGSRPGSALGAAADAHKE